MTIDNRINLNINTKKCEDKYCDGFNNELVNCCELYSTAGLYDCPEYTYRNDLEKNMEVIK